LKRFVFHSLEQLFNRRLNWAVFLGLTTCFSANMTAYAQDGTQRFSSQAGELTVVTIAQGLHNPWGLAFLPDGRMLVTERPGRLRVVTTGGLISAPIGGIPEVYAQGQGGLLDVTVDPAFTTNRFIYVSFSELRADGAGTSVARLKLNAALTAVEQTAIIFRQQPSHRGSLHFGSRLVFDRTGALFITLGDRYDLREQAQVGSNTVGKIVRIHTDGSIPTDNPALNSSAWISSIWSIGHRNIQGAALNPLTGRLWTAEHGARGGDEVNSPLAGKNYGWPVITYGRDYSGATIGEGTSKTGMEQPIHYWDPSIAPSGMSFYTGDKVPSWKASVFVGALAGQMLVRLTVQGEKVLNEERLLVGLKKRIRDVRQGPDGWLYLLSDSSAGEVLRVSLR
jgi:aldose sugar dehydrogenase